MSHTADELREEVRRRYAESARAVTGDSGGCGGGSCCAGGDGDPNAFGEALYGADQRGQLPDAAVLASLGCGTPRRWPTWNRARRCSTWAPGVGST